MQAYDLQQGVMIQVNIMYDMDALLHLLFLLGYDYSSMP